MHIALHFSNKTPTIKIPTTTTKTKTTTKNNHATLERHTFSSSFNDSVGPIILAGKRIFCPEFTGFAMPLTTAPRLFAYSGASSDSGSVSGPGSSSVSEPVASLLVVLVGKGSGSATIITGFSITGVAGASATAASMFTGGADGGCV